MSSASVKSAVTLISAGTQGRRLAFMWSKGNRPVFLVDKNPEQLSAAWKEIQRFRSEAEGVNGAGDQHPAWGKVMRTGESELALALSQSWLAVECVPEDLTIKKALVRDLARLAGHDTIIASNSSSYTITQILDGLDVGNQDRFVSLHSYWPPETPAIEIMGSRDTRLSIIQRLMEETQNHGFVPFHVRKPSTGYIYNRIWAAIKRETLLVLQEGVAEPHEIDGIFRSVLKTPKGPCEQMDIVGLDVVRDIEEHYAEERAGIPPGPREFLQAMIREGKLGVKSKQGFYKYHQ